MGGLVLLFVIVAQGSSVKSRFGSLIVCTYSRQLVKLEVGDLSLQSYVALLSLSVKLEVMRLCWPFCVSVHSCL